MITFKRLKFIFGGKTFRDGDFIEYKTINYSAISNNKFERITIGKLKLETIIKAGIVDEKTGEYTSIDIDEDVMRPWKIEIKKVKK